MFKQKQKQFEEISIGLHCLLALLLCIYHFQYIKEPIAIIGVFLIFYTLYILSSLYTYALNGHTLNFRKHIDPLIDLIIFALIIFDDVTFFELLLPLFCIQILISTLKNQKVSSGVLYALGYSFIASYHNIQQSPALTIVQCLLLIVFQYVVSELNKMFNGILEKNTHAMTEIEYKNKLLEHSSKTDFLTDMYNHQAFYASLNATSSTHIPIALILFDIDHFKQINDSYGHVTGDYVIREIAYLIKLNLREKDIAARYGGEEYAVLLPKSDLETARKLAEQIRQAIANHTFEFEGISLNITVSGGVGVSHYLLANKQAQSHFVNHVDALLYSSKRNGRNQITTSTAHDNFEEAQPE